MTDKAVAMKEYDTILFDLYNTIIEGEMGFIEKEQYRLDSIYTILEKSLYPIKFQTLKEKVEEATAYSKEFEAKTGRQFIPFEQVDYLLKYLNITDFIVFKKVYDAYVDPILQISPKLIKNTEKSLSFLKERGKKIGLISNTARTPGHILRLLLKELGVFHYFDDMVFSDEVGISKPNPMIFEVALKRLGAVKEKALFIGDLKTIDYDGAIAAGLSAHLFRKDEEDLFQLAVSYAGGYDE